MALFVDFPPTACHVHVVEMVLALRPVIPSPVSH